MTLLRDGKPTEEAGPGGGESPKSDSAEDIPVVDPTDSGDPDPASPGPFKYEFADNPGYSRAKPPKPEVSGSRFPSPKAMFEPTESDSAWQPRAHEKSPVRQAHGHGGATAAGPIAFSMPRYQHSPIRETSVRLLCLLPGNYYDPVYCILRRIRLAGIRQMRLQYQALSYAWDNEQPSRTIVIQGSRSKDKWAHLITVGLFKALLRLRSKDKNVWLWVDSICINQLDAREKNQQIPLMPDIYSSAWSVTVWLGESDNFREQAEAHRAMDFIPSILNLKLLDRLTEEEGRDAEGLRSWIAFANLLRRPWFQRRWVIQEVALGGRAAVRCGAKIVNWIDFSDAITLFFTKLDRIRLLYDTSELSKSNPDAFSHAESSGAQAMVNATNGVLRKSGHGAILDRLWNLETLVTKFNSFETSNPRDTVYALLSLARDGRLDTWKGIGSKAGETGPLVPNYDLHPIDCYIQFVSHCIRSSGSLDILVRHWAQNLNRDPIPSWIGTVNDSAFGAPSSFSGRINGDSLVGEPGQPVYNASRGLAAESWIMDFSESLGGALVRLLPAEQPSEATVNNLPSPSTYSGTTMQEDRSVSLSGHNPSRKRKRRHSEPGLSVLISEAVEQVLVDGNPVMQRSFHCIAAEHQCKNINSSAYSNLRPPGGARDYNGIIHAQGVVLTELSEVSPRVVDGTISDDCLRILGWEHSDDVNTIPDKLWRTLVADRGPDGRNAPTWYKRACAFALTKTSPEGDLNTSKLIGSKAQPISLIEYLKRVQNVVWSRRFFSARPTGKAPPESEPLVGFGSRHIRRGDLVCVLFGCSVPVIMRPTYRPNREIRGVKLMGECFVYGKMDGEIFAGMDREAIDSVTINFEIS